MIPEINPYNNYRGDSVATKFDYDFLIQDASQLIVQKITEDDVAINLVNNVDYEIKEIGNVNGGYINFPLASSEHSILTEKETISLQLTLPFEQESEYGQSSMLNLGSLEFSLDYLTRLCQILKRQMERSVKANEGNDIIDITLPPPKANNTFAWNEDCSALVNYDIIGENNAFKSEMVEEFQSARDEFNATIATNKQEILDIQEDYEQENNAKFESYQYELDAKFETVADAANRINELDNDLAIATNAAEKATQEAQNAKEQAEIATNKADEILNVKDELEAEIGTKANVDLSNLSEVGEKHFLGKSQITNCLTEIPQRIKYTLVDGVLTILAGSIAIVPYGIEDLTAQYPIGSTFLHENFKVTDTQFSDGKFFVWVELVNDLSPVAIGTDTRMIMLMYDGTISTSAIQFVGSGALSSADGSKGRWYDTTTNLIKEKKNDAWNANTYLSFPFMVCQADGTNFTSVDEVFNGMGYIGSTIWIDKGVKGLAPNGRNEDGSLKNEEWNTDKLITRTIDSSRNSNSQLFAVNSNEPVEGIAIGSLAITDFSYDPKENRNYQIGANLKKEWRYTPIAVNATLTNGVISNFKPKQPFRAVDYNDFQTLNNNALLDSDKSTISGWGFPSDKTTSFTLGASGSSYTAPANGWFQVNKTATAATQSLIFYASIAKTVFSTGNGQRVVNSIPVRKGQTCKIDYSLGGATNEFKFIYAEGEK